MINSAYGRFGLALEGDETTLEWDDDLGDWQFRSHYIDDSKMDGYIPFAVFVTAWARRHLTDNMYNVMRAYGPDAVIHCDTDSVVHYGEPVDTEDTVHGEHVGTWGIESVPAFVLEAGFKRYMEFSTYPPTSINDLVGMACAGVPQKWDYDHKYPVGMWVELLSDPDLMLRDGYELGHAEYSITSPWLRELYIKHGADPDRVDTRKLIPKPVPGGVILEPRTHRLNDNLIWRLRR